MAPRALPERSRVCSGGAGVSLIGRSLHARVCARAQVPAARRLIFRRIFRDYFRTIFTAAARQIAAHPPFEKEFGGESHAGTSSFTM